MSDPLGLIGGVGGGVGGVGRGVGVRGPGLGVGSGAEAEAGGPTFREVLLSNLNQVNEAQQDADRAVEDLVSGRRGDVEGVILATQKADDAFRMLQAVRGKVMQAYEEIKQVRV